MALKVTVLLAACAVVRDVAAIPLAADNTTTADFEFGVSSTGTEPVSYSNVATTSSVPPLATVSSNSTSYDFTTSTDTLGPVSSTPVADSTSPTISAATDTATTEPPTPLALLPPGILPLPTPLPSVTFPPSPPLIVQSTTTVVSTSTVFQSASTSTVTAPAQTITSTLTIVTPPTPSSTIHKSTWSSPPQMTNLAAFNIQNFAYGKKNMQIVVSDTATDVADKEAKAESGYGSLADILGSLLHAIAAGLMPSPPVKNTSSYLQLFYPENSINPAQEPQGGADFYATPLDLSMAQNVSLEYSVFFPSDFDWVQGGKMPGIYGGHQTCSGGDDALKCFSTRLMWRAGGIGELYLYAPKAMQTEALCNTPPESVCDEDYGLSVGRGSFKFAAGGWTHVKQTITLNTPGEQDGGFTLDVNGHRVIDRNDVYYRGDPNSEATGVSDLADAPADDDDDDWKGDDGEDGSDDGDNEGSDHDVDDDARASGNRSVFMDADQDYFGTLIARRLKVDSVLTDANLASSSPAYPSQTVMSSGYAPALASDSSSYPTPAPSSGSITESGQLATSTLAADAAPATTTMILTTTATSIITMIPPAQTVTVIPTVTKTAYAVAMESSLASPLSVMQLASKDAVGFTGLFFSTFFGGHEERFATPKDQFSWFKDFSMTINS